MNKDLQKEKRNYILLAFSSLIGIIVSSFILSICIKVFKFPDNSSLSIIVIPFFICIIAVLLEKVIAFILGCAMLILIGKENYEKQAKMNEIYGKIVIFSKKMYIVGFSIFWFGFLIVFDYLLIKEWSSTSIIALLFTLIFWVAGFRIIKKNWKKFKK